MEYREMIRDCLRNIKGKNFNIEEGLVFNGWLDSIERIELINVLEKSFHFTLPVNEIDIDQLDSIDNICTLVRNHLEEL